MSDRTPQYLLLKTEDRHVEGVRRHQMHATDQKPRALVPGDYLLIQVTKRSAKVQTEPLIRYLMVYVDCIEDSKRESDKIWGRHWRYVFHGKNLRILRHPFSIERLQESDKNYGEAVKYAYVDPVDVAVLKAGGYLDVT